MNKIHHVYRKRSPKKAFVKKRFQNVFQRKQGIINHQKQNKLLFFFSDAAYLCGDQMNHWMKLKTSSNLQKQFVGAQKKISKKFCKIHKITHTMESFFINVSGNIFTNERTPCSCSPVKFKGSFRASVYWTTVRRSKRMFSIILEC